MFKNYRNVNNLKISEELLSFVNKELLKDLDISSEKFWKGFDNAVHDLTPQNKELIQIRENLQKKIDDWHIKNKGNKIEIERSANHLFVASIDFETLKINRNEFMLSLRESNIITQVHYIPLTEQPFYKQLGFKSENFPHSQKYYKSAISLPLYFGLTDEDFNFVVSTIEEKLKV